MPRNHIIPTVTVAIWVWLSGGHTSAAESPTSPRIQRLDREWLLVLALGPFLAGAVEVIARVVHEPTQQTVTIANNARTLALRLRYDERCVLDQVLVDGRNVVATKAGAWTGVKVGDQWHTTRQNLATPKVATTENTATISQLVCAGGGVQLKETWEFTAGDDRILWRNEREYQTGGRVEDVAFAG